MVVFYEKRKNIKNNRVASVASSKHCFSRVRLLAHDNAAATRLLNQILCRVSSSRDNFIRNRSNAIWKYRPCFSCIALRNGHEKQGPKIRTMLSGTANNVIRIRYLF